jgi:hypothetical protein
MASTPYSENLTSSEFTQQTMLNDLTRQPWLIGLGLGIGLLLLMRMRKSDDREVAARRLVRDWRHVDDVDDARDLLGSNLGIIMRPALLMILEELQQQSHRLFRRLEKSIERL